MIGVVYKIHTPKTEKIYIGSCQYELFRNRTNNHRTIRKDCNSRILFQIDKDCEITIIETIEYTDDRELLDREQYYMDLYRDIIVNERNTYSRYNQQERSRKSYVKNIEKNKNRNKKSNYENNIFYRKSFCNKCYEYLKMLECY